MKFVELDSERLFYRKFSYDDFPVVFDWLGNSENMKYRRGEPRSEAETRDYLSWAILNAEADDCINYEFAVILKTDGSLIGAATLMNLPDEPEIGWTLHRDYWRQGYGTEIGETMLRLGFDMLGLRRMIAGCNARNRGSWRIMEKIGMRREACFVKAQQGGQALNNEWCDRLQYAILHEEWGAAKPEIIIVPYESKYRDDMLFCYLAAKDAISSYAPEQWSKPALRDDLLDIERSYIDHSDVFYLAVDEHDRVVGMIGTKTVLPTDLWLKRLFIKPELKGKGIGSKLLAAVEEYAIRKGITTIHTRFANWYREAAVFYPAKGFVEVEPDVYFRVMVKRLV